MSDIMANTFAAYLNASAYRYSILLRSHLNANDPTFFSTPSLLIARVIYFKYDCDKTRFLACRYLFWRGPKARNKEKKIQQQTSTENKQHPHWKEGPAEHIVRSDTKHDGMTCRRGGETHCQQFMCCANDFSITQCSQPHDSAYCLCQSCQGVSTPSGREQKPTIHIFQDVKPHKKKEVPLFTLHIISADSLSSALCLSFNNLKYLEEAQNKP